jgi:hypothetical protein
MAQLLYFEGELNMRKLLAFVILVVILAPAAQAATYEIHVTGGTTFTTRSAPIVAEFDSSFLMFMSDQSNWVNLPAAIVTEIIVVEEALGYGIVIDDVTLMIGFTPNDNLSPEEQAELEAAGVDLPDAPYTGGGIPVGFLNVNTPPMGGVSAGGGGALSTNRRGGGGTVIDVEPVSQF